MGLASFVFWCSTARSSRSGHHSELRTILRELCVPAPGIGEEVSVAVAGWPPCGTGHFISFDIVVFLCLCRGEGLQLWCHSQVVLVARGSPPSIGIPESW